MGRLVFHPLLRPHESRKQVQAKLSTVLKEETQTGQWKYLWETPKVCKVCHTDTNAQQPTQMCTSCYQQVHHVCLSNDAQAAPIPICRACASTADPGREEVAAAEAPCLPDDEPRKDEPGRPRPNGSFLDPSGVVPCPDHGMDHLTRDPSCEFCKKALGPLYRHLKDKYGMRLDDQTPSLSFDKLRLCNRLGVAQDRSLRRVTPVGSNAEKR